MIHSTQPYPWEFGTELGLVISVTVPLNHHPAPPGISVERSNRNVSPIGKQNRFLLKDSIKMLLGRSHCNSLCGSDRVRKSKSHLWPNREVTVVAPEGKDEGNRAALFKIFSLWGRRALFRAQVQNDRTAYNAMGFQITLKQKRWYQIAL